jgi:hypothetical protein
LFNAAVSAIASFFAYAYVAAIVLALTLVRSAAPIGSQARTASQVAAMAAAGLRLAPLRLARIRLAPRRLAPRRRLRFFVASAHVWDLLILAKHLFVAARVGVTR